MLDAITELKLESNVITAVGKTTETLDTQVVAASLSRPIDREEARQKIEKWMRETLPPEYLDQHIQIGELTPIFRWRFVEKLPPYPVRTYYENQTLGSLSGENLYLRNCKLVGATIGDVAYMDTLDCDFTKAKFVGVVRDTVQQGTALTDATLPAQIPFFNHDMIVEAFGQGLSLLSSSDREKLREVSEFTLSLITNRYDHSWEDGIVLIVARFGADPLREFVTKTLAQLNQQGLIDHFEEWMRSLSSQGRI